MKRFSALLFVLISTVNSACMKQKAQLAVVTAASTSTAVTKNKQSAQLQGSGQTNLVIDANFEDGTNTWTGNSFQVVNNNQHSGNYCVKLTGSNSIVEQVVTSLQPNTNYTFTAYLKTTNGTDQVYLGAKEFGGSEVHVATTAAAYQLLTVHFKTGAASTSAKLFMWRDNNGSGDAYGDEACLAMPNKASLFWLHFNSTPISTAMIQTEAARRKLIVLNAWEYSYISQFKAVNPDVLMYVYKDLSSTRDYSVHNGVDDAYLPTGVGYVYANSNHPEWFLKDGSGNRLTYSGYAGHWQMDIGNSAYQNYWATQVKNELVAKNWDGVFMDNALVEADMYHTGVFPASYPTHASIRQAYQSLFAVTHPALAAASKKSFPNMSNARLQPGAWNGYLQDNDGGFDEWWLVFGTNNYLPDYAQGWTAQAQEAVSAESQDKMALVQPHSAASDLRGFRYALASYWLVNKGNTLFSEQETTDGYGDPSPWRAEYDWDMGIPNSDYYTWAPGVYRREFIRAMVIVNANQTGTVTINLGQSCLDENNTIVTSVTVDGLTGRILRKL